MSIKLSKEDRLILDSYKNMIDGLSDYFGSGFEFVLHDLENLNSSVVKIVNGHYTGRKEGSPITDLALSMLAEIESGGSPDYITYFGKNKNKENLKSSTIAIRGKNNNVIGLLCMNFYMDIPFSYFLRSFVAKEQVKESLKHPITENYVEDVDDLITDTVNLIRHNVYNDIGVASVNKNKEIIHQLYQRGIFNLKDGVVATAKLLNISKNTVYMHLRNLAE